MSGNVSFHDLPEFDVDDLVRAIREIEMILSAGRPFRLNIPKRSRNFRPAIRYLIALSGSADSRSPLVALVDAWRLQHFAACLGLAESYKYGMTRQENDDGIVLIFTPP